MKAYVFECSSRPVLEAVSVDPDGANLPAASCPGGTWRKVRDLDLADPGGAVGEPGDTASVKDVLARRGWHIASGSLVRR